MCSASTYVRFTPDNDRESGHRWWISEASAFMAPCGGVRRQTGPISSSGRCRIKTAFNTLRDKGIELRVRHTLHNYWGDGGLGLLRHQRCS